MHQYKREHRVSVYPCISSKLNLMFLYRSNHHLSFLLPTEWIHVSQTVTWSLDWRHTDHTLKGLFCFIKIIHRRRICAYLHSTNRIKLCSHDTTHAVSASLMDRTGYYRWTSERQSEQMPQMHILLKHIWMPHFVL